MYPSGIRIHTVNVAAVDQARSSGRDVNGTAVEPVVAGGGEPLRCCLADAETGDDLLLFGYRPRLPAASPYLETGAVFVHATACGGPASSSSYPRDWLHRPKCFAHTITAAGFTLPPQCTTVLTHRRSSESVLGRPSVVVAHSRNIEHGCFMFAATLTI